MRKMKERKTDHPITVDIETLAGMLSCGQATAKQIGEAANAKIVIGRRILYSVSKIKEYIDSIAI